MTAKKTNTIKTFFKLLPIVYKADPVLFIVSQILFILAGVSFGVIILFTQRFFDVATRFVGGNVTLRAVIIALLLLGLAYVINQIFDVVEKIVSLFCAENVDRNLSIGIHKKIAKLSPVDFENTALLNDINKAIEGKWNSLELVFIYLGIFTYSIPYFLFMSVYLFSLKPILVVSIVLVFIPILVTQIIRTKVFTKLADDSAPIRREYDYYENCMVSREYFKETRLLGGFHFFKDLYVDSLRFINKLRFKAQVKTNFYELGMKVLTLCGYFIIVYLLFDALMRGEISVGAFAAVFTSIGMLFGMMHDIICRQLGWLAEVVGTVQNYLNFLDMKEHGGKDIEIPQNADITVSNVSFAYPNVIKAKANVITNAVNNVSFTIKNSETIAIVGENGSGKSTLIRLITGMYSPTSGDVFYNDTNTRDVSLKSLFCNMSAVFQKHQKYQLTLRENICISKTDKDFDDTELDRVCELSGVNKDDTSYTNGYDTMLSREFDGVDLSGGQWQRLAIARAFFRPHNMIILDEPTAAIDPFEETKIYNRFAEISKDKTAIIVTHRLGSVKLADRIIVMSKGNLVETGTHESLMKHGGEYARMYASQEQWYKE